LKIFKISGEDLNSLILNSSLLHGNHYQALDTDGNTVDFYLSSTRSINAAKRFLSKALKSINKYAYLVPSIWTEIQLIAKQLLS